MRQRKHLRLLSRTPEIAQSNFQVKLESTTQIIDRLLLADRQAPWKAVGGEGDDDTDDDTTDGTTDTEV